MIMYWSDRDGWPLRIYKWSSLPGRSTVLIWPPQDKGTMLPVALFYLVAVICSARRTHALPLYTDTNLEPQAGKTWFLLFYSPFYLLSSTTLGYLLCISFAYEANFSLITISLLKYFPFFLITPFHPSKYSSNYKNTFLKID